MQPYRAHFLLHAHWAVMVKALLWHQLKPTCAHQTGRDEQKGEEEIEADKWTIESRR